MKRFIAALLGVVLVGCADASPDDLDPFPDAGDGQARHVIRLPALEDESDARVELFVGKELDVDCNQQWFAGQLSTEVIEGWGYTYYVVDSVGGPASTLKACPEDTKTSRFVSIRLGDQLLSYNSRLPVVVYVPEGFEVRYRVWRADALVEAATAG